MLLIKYTLFYYVLMTPYLYSPRTVRILLVNKYINITGVDKRDID